MHTAMDFKVISQGRFLPSVPLYKWSDGERYFDIKHLSWSFFFPSLVPFTLIGIGKGKQEKSEILPFLNKG